jgi:hypothetical protein
MRTSFWSFIGKSSLHLLLLIIKAILQWPKIVCWVLSSIQKWTSKICGLFKFFKFWELSWKSYFKIRDLYQIACNKLMLTTAPWQTNQSSNPYLERTCRRWHKTEWQLVSFGRLSREEGHVGNWVIFLWIALSNGAENPSVEGQGRGTHVSFSRAILGAFLTIGHSTHWQPTIYI